MKRFVIISVVCLLAALGIYYAVYYCGFYIDLGLNKEIEVISKTDEKSILIKNDKGDYEKIIIKGVDVPSSIPSHYSTDYAVDKETWLRWFALIQEMGANTIRITTIYNDVFYNSLYEYNNNNPSPLYLLQGIAVTDYDNNSGKDAYSSGFYGSLMKDAVNVVDIVHGRKNIFLNNTKGYGIYRKDISQWVIGYVTGLEWNSNTAAYTNHQTEYSAVYEGKYIYTAKEATVFEAMLARVMDRMVAYESNKYNTQRVISFINEPQNDPFEYEELYAKQIGKHCIIDAEHLKASDELKSGYFASYRLYEYCPGFADYFSESQKEKLKNILPYIDKELYYEGYTQLLSEYHTIPVLITGYGFSSARGIDNVNVKNGPLTEEEQGEQLVKTYNDFIKSGCCGGVISEWQDVWQRRTWNTAYAIDMTDNQKWQDYQTSGQGYGLLSFDEGENERICYADGNKADWSGDEPVFEGAGYKLYAKYDRSAIYIMIEKENIEGDELYIPVDITPNSGSSNYNNELIFERAADFLICISGKENSRLLVHSRYEALRENYLMQITGDDPFVGYPNTDALEFVPINMILENKFVVTDLEDEAQLLDAKYYDVFETGRLIYGNQNPGSSDYSSTADFCYGSGFVEIRLPWALINVSNPVEMKIHDDYYVNYGVEHINVKECYIGIAGRKNTKTSIGTDALEAGRAVKMSEFKLDKISSSKYHERLKKSYYIVQEAWN